MGEPGQTRIQQTTTKRDKQEGRGRANWENQREPIGKVNPESCRPSPRGRKRRREPIGRSRENQLARLSIMQNPADHHQEGEGIERTN